ncbi:Nodulation protein noeI [Hibiscus syriacus]|uniref:Nodulation protein noeI n=1 Tax=Hibiscus syriacus TaxID=106335 RepID=A0A6A2YV44_HIBSY|nr:Nodulation protein noeI [Hibiscus syriacus]
MFETECSDDVVDVLDFGAVGDGTADSSEAFLKALNFVCSREVEDGVRIILVPENRTFLLHPLTFNGPCTDKEIKFLVEARSTDEVGVGGTNHADIIHTWKGALHWHQHSLSQVRLMNNSQTHVLIRGTNDFVVDNLVITAPETRPNTDGIHISSASNIFIRNSELELVGKGYVRGVIFENLSFESVKNPIIIDQNYCNVRGAFRELERGLQECYCNLLLQSVLLKSALTGKNVSSSCINAHGAAIGVVQPAPCFQDFDH